MTTLLRLLLVAALATTATLGPSESARAQSISSLAAPALVALAPSGNLVPDLKVGIMNLIPDDALGFVVATDVLETKKEGEAVLRRLKVPFDTDNYADFTKFLDKIEGWDPKAAHALVVVPDEDDEEAFVLVPVTDYKKFAASFGADPEAKGPTKYEIEDGPSGFMAEKANYAIMGGPHDVELLQRVLDSKKSIASSCEQVKPYLAKHKTALVIAPPGMKKLLDTAIDGLKSFRDSMPKDNPQAESIAQAMSIYDKIFVTLREEATHLAVAGEFNERVGADFSMQFIFKPDGKLAAMSKDITPLPPEAFAGIPDEPYIFAGAGVMPTAMSDALAGYSASIMGTLPQGEGGMSPEQAKIFGDAIRDTMKNVRRFATSVDFAGETIYSGIAAVYKVDDAEKFIEQNEKSMNSMKDLGKADKAMPKYTAARKKIDGLDVLEISTDMSAMLEQMEKTQGPGGKLMYQAMFGPEAKMDAYMTAVDKETVAFTYDLAALKSLLASVKSGKKDLGANVDLQKTAALLLKQPHVIGFMDVGGYIELAKKIASAFMAGQGAPGGAFPFPIPPFPASPPVGMAGKLTPQAVEVQLVVPMPLMENTRDYIQQINALVGGGLR